MKAIVICLFPPVVAISSCEHSRKIYFTNTLPTLLPLLQLGQRKKLEIRHISELKELQKSTTAQHNTTYLSLKNKSPVQTVAYW